MRSMKYCALMIPVFGFCPQVFAFDVFTTEKLHRASFSLEANGKLARLESENRIGTAIWSATNGSETGLLLNGASFLDWGDIESNSVGGFQIAYCVDGAPTFDLQVLFLGEENGNQAHTDTFLGGFNVSGLPGGSGFSCWIISLDLDPNFSFVIAGSDLDLIDGKSPNFSGVGLVDFGYTYGPLSANVTQFGVFNAVDDVDAPGSTTAPGIEDVFDTFDSDGVYLGAVNFGGWPANPFAQILLEIDGPDGSTGCPNDPAANCEDSDIFPSGGGDCQVNLPDLGVVLSNYAPGVHGKTRDEGDVFPSGGGNGVVDLADLGQMLSDFGTDCR